MQQIVEKLKLAIIMLPGIINSFLSIHEALNDNDSRSIIDICFYAIFSTPFQ
jgi:hypothetical protein